MPEPVILPDFVEIKTDIADNYEKESDAHHEAITLNEPFDAYDAYDPIDNNGLNNTDVSENIPEVNYSEVMDHQPDIFAQNDANYFQESSHSFASESIDSTPKEVDSNICSICSKEIKCKTAMKYHMNIHRGLKPYKCATCDADYADRRNLLAHTKKHNHLMPHIPRTYKKRHIPGNRNWTCTPCGIDFDFEDNLIDHCNIYHKVNSVLCEEPPKDKSSERDIEMADYKLNAQQASDEHDPISQHSAGVPSDSNLQSAHANNEDDDDGDDTTISVNSARGGVCRVCKKKFACKTGLKYHMNLHLGIKPYSCDVCSRSFADKRNLNAHKKIHKALANIVDDFTEIINDKTILTKEQLKSLVCPVCNKAFSSKKGLQHHVSVHDREKYLCKLCGKTFRDVQTYQRHRITHKDEVENKDYAELSIRNYGDDSLDDNAQNAVDWICEYCNGDFEYEIRLAKHIMKEHDETKSEHACNLCEQKFERPNELLMHVRAHPESTQHKCTFDGCGHAFAYKSSLGVHVNKHNRLNGRIERKTQDQLTQLTKQHALLKMADDKSAIEKTSLTCSKCNKQFPSRTNLLTHIQVVHTNERLKCTVAGCDKIFKTNAGIVGHIQNIHPEEIKQCDVCQKSFYSEEKLAEHRLNHSKSEKISFDCNLCDKMFPNKHALRVHLTQHEKDFSCNVCNEKFSSVKQMMQHRERHGKKPSITCRFKGCNEVFENRREFIVHSNQHPNSERKKFICSYCGKAMSSMAYLKDHVNIHTGKRPYQCAFCEKRFSKDGSLRRHHMIHTGAKPYVCQIEGCNNAYRDSIDLKRHKFSAHNIYTKKHICSICTKIFPERKLLTKHSVSVHGKIDAPIEQSK